MLIFFLRYFFFLFAFVGLMIAILFWRFAEPPAWSVFLTPVRAEILATRIDPRPTGGKTYYYPVVEVAWPDAPEGKEALIGLMTAFTEKSHANAVAILEKYQEHKKADILVIDKHPYANRTDVFSLVGAIFASLLSVFGLIVGILLNRGFRNR